MIPADVLHCIIASLEHCVQLHVDTGNDHFQHDVRQSEVSQWLIHVPTTFHHCWSINNDFIVASLGGIARGCFHCKNTQFCLLQTSCRHYGGDKLVCPVCGVMVKPQTEFIALDKLGNYKPTVRWVADLGIRDTDQRIHISYADSSLRWGCFLVHDCVFLKPSLYWYVHHLCIMEHCCHFHPFSLLSKENGGRKIIYVDFNFWGSNHKHVVTIFK